MRTTRKTRIAVAAAAGSLVAIGLGGVGAFAASSAFSPAEESQAVIDDAAAQLGVEPDALSDALEQALENRLDDAVDSGRLTEEQAERLKERLDSAGVPLLFGHGWRGLGGGFHRPHGLELFAGAASYLGMTETELREALVDQTLAEIAEEQGKTVAGLVQSLVATAERRIDEAVSDGRLTQEQATQLEAGLEERIERFVDGDFRRSGFGRRPGFRQWHMPRGPPPGGPFG